MKHLLLLFGAIALVHIASAGQNGRKNVNFNEDGSITIHAANGKEITICKPGLTGQKRFEVIVTGPHMPRKRIYVEYPEEGDYSEMNYRTNPRNEEGERYKRSHKHYHELFVKILQPYEGYVNEEDYEKILKDVEKAVKKGDIHYVLLALLQSLVQEKLWNDLVKGQGMFMGSKTPAYDDVMYYGRPSYNYNTRPYYYEPYGYQSYKPGGYGGQGMYGNSPYGSYGASYPYYSSGGSSFPQMPRPLSSQSYIRPEVEHQVHLPVQRYTRGSFGAEVNAKEVDYRDSTSMFDHQIHPEHGMYHEIEPSVHYSMMHHMHPLEHPVHPRMMQGIRWNMDRDVHSNADSEIHSNVEHDHSNLEHDHSKWDHSNLDHSNLDYSNMGRDHSSIGRDHSSIGRDHSNLEVNMHTYPEHGIHYVPEHGIHYNPEHGIHYNPELGIHYTPEHRFHSEIHSNQEHAIRSNSNQEQDIHQERSPEQHSIRQETNPNEHRIWGHSAVHITQEKLEKNRHV